MVVAGRPRHLALYDRSVGQADRRMVEPVAQSVGRWRQTDRRTDSIAAHPFVANGQRQAEEELGGHGLGLEVALVLGLVRLVGPEDVDQLGTLRLAGAGPGAPRDPGGRDHHEGVR